MQFNPDLAELKQAFSHQNQQLSHLKDVLAELDPRVALSMAPGVIDAIDEALDVSSMTKPGAALPLIGRRG